VARSNRASNRSRKSTDVQADDAAKKPVVKLPPEEPAARDEGPRLIPFPAEMKMALEPPRVKHYLDLAEKALGPDRKKTE
jgi:hypothetical protein